MNGRTLGALLVASAALLLTGCVVIGAVDARPSNEPWTPERASVPADVTSTGMVIDAGKEPRLCLGPIMESYPPQCSGPRILGWDWDAADGEESAVGATWGFYVVWGVWDGETLTITREPVLAAPKRPTADPTASDPRDQVCEPGGPPVLPELREAARDIVSVMTDLASLCVVVEVEYDDGTLQAAVDERFGEGAIVISSSFAPVDDD